MRFAQGQRILPLEELAAGRGTPLAQGGADPMTSSRYARAPQLARGSVAALLLLAVAAGPVLAISWGGEAKLTSAHTYRPEILRTGPSSAIAVWTGGSAVYARRTADGGATWTPRTTLAGSGGLYGSVAGIGRRIDLAYVKVGRCSDGSQERRLFYRRSLDGGATWSTARPLTSACSQIADQDVARHSNGQVSVAWTGLYTGRMFMRTSTDGGANFGPAQPAGQTYNSEPGTRTTYVGDPTLAIGDGVTYLGYTSTRDALSIRRSLNLGASWSAPLRLDRFASGFANIATTGARAIIGYTSTSTGSARALYRRTGDRGSTWGSARMVVPLAAGEYSAGPQFTYRAGVLVVLVARGKPGTAAIRHRQSSNFGTDWSASTTVSRIHVPPPVPENGNVAILDARQLAIYNENGDSVGLWVRRSRV